MREILFRAKKLVGGEWVYGWYCMYPFGRWPLKSAIIPSTPAHEGYHAFEEVDPETVSENTGLVDASGHMIFEGDILRLSDKEKNVEVIAEVRWRDKDGLWAVAAYNEFEKYVFLPLGNCPQYGIEVIGNIYDNAEMLP